MIPDKELRQVWAEVDLAHLIHNYFAVCKRLKPGTEIMPVIKGDAYGHGAIEVSRQLLKCGVNFMAVSSIAEGIELRQAGIDIPLLILEEAVPQGADAIIDNYLTPSICSFSMLTTLARSARQKQKRIKVHVRVDTSGGGTGLLPAEFELFVKKIMEMPWLELEGIFTHLFAAYTSDRENVGVQLNIFNGLLKKTRELGTIIPLAHAASSPAILDHKDAHYNLVRPGILLYGLSPYEGASIADFKPVMQLKGRIINIKEINSGNYLGYTHNISIKNPLRIATVPMGYGDGFFLFLMKDGEVLIRGKRAPFFSRPCTATFRVDVTGIAGVREGDEVVIFGRQGNKTISAEEVAARAGIGVINCETVCLLHNRLPRIFMGQEKDSAEFMAEGC